MGNKTGKKKSTSHASNYENKLNVDQILTERDLDFLTTQTGRSVTDIKSLFQDFITNNPDGQLDQNEFIRLYTNLRPEPSDMLKKISTFVFKAFDLDQNGTIDFNEFMISYSLTSRGDLKQKLEYAFNAYDIDKNGFLDRDELKQVIYGMFDLLGVDEKSNDPKILAEQCIRELDASNDGRVSKKEFIDGLSRNYSMRALLCPFN